MATVTKAKPSQASAKKVKKNKQPIASVDTGHWSALNNQVLQTANSLQQSLTHNRDNNVPAFIESYCRYTELWQQIATEAYSYGFHGLCDVCMLFHASALEIGQQQGMDDNQGLLLEEWQELFMIYLDTPELDSSRNDLVSHLQEPSWPDPLPEEDVEILKSLLLPEPVAFTVSEEDASDQGEDVAADANVITIAPDLVELIRVEFEPYAESMLVALQSESAKTMAPEQFNLAIAQQMDELEMLAKVAETVNLIGLQRVFDSLLNNMQALFSGQLRLEDAQAQLLKTALSHILHYLVAIDDTAKGAALAQHFQNPLWPAPLSEFEVQALIASFNVVTLLSEEQARGPKKIASAEDVALTVPDDVNQELLESLYNELPMLTADFTEAVQQLLRSGDIADVETAQRIAHTLKGSGNLVGITGIATLTHNIEEILEKVALHDSMPQGVFDTLLMDSAECLEAMSDTILGKGVAPDNAQTLLQQLLDWTYHISAEGIPDSIEVPATVEAQVKPIDKAFETRANPRTGTTETMTRIPSILVEDMLRMAGENNILTGQIQQRLGETINQSLLMRVQNNSLLDLIAELEQLVDVQGIASNERNTTLNDDFDPLEMDQYNELHTCSHQLLEVATDAQVMTAAVNSQLGELKDLLVVQERLQKDNHELVLRTRMAPVQSIVPRFHRAIRQACRITGKTVQLNVIGADTLIDREILNSLIDSLMHLLRNAVDHGIESAQQRLVADKPETGNITLEFSRRGNNIIVICQDDGSGLDLVKIRATAEQKNLITADQTLTDQELQRLVLMPGFSTRATATQVSGRGIGMDAVHVQIMNMKGELILASELGNGCRIELVLPATLASVRALLVRCGDQLIAVSNRSLEQILYPGAGKLKVLGNDLAYQMDDKIYSAKRFETLLNIPGADNTVTESSLSALLFKTETGEMQAILVEQVVDSRELVVKNMGQYVPEIPGVTGATILGDGSVTPVLDIPDLLRTSQGLAVTQRHQRTEQLDPSRHLPTALVVDDSLSARRSLAQLLKDMGYNVITAIDGVDAIDKIDEKRPDIILVDLEMPRMNGIELTAHVRNRADIKNLPVIMITSRATEKHRQQAENAGVNMYLIKPFSEDELMGHVNKAVGVI